MPGAQCPWLLRTHVVAYNRSPVLAGAQEPASDIELLTGRPLEPGRRCSPPLPLWGPSAAASSAVSAPPPLSVS